MILFIVLGVVVLGAFIVLGILFFMLGKENEKKEERKAVPLTDLEQLRQEISPGMLTPEKPKPASQLETIPTFTPKVALPVQEAKTPVDDAYKKRAQELEEELKGISAKAETQVQEAKGMIEILTEENESLKRQRESLQEAQKKLDELQLEASQLKTDNTGLQSQLEATNAKVQLLEEQMAAVKVQMGDELARANATVAQLTQEKEALASAPKPEPDAGLRQELESLGAELGQLRQKYDDLEKEHQQLRELNGHLMEKNEQFQYEMIKARAQSSGLERVSFNYKNQLEDFFKKINAVQVTNEQLSQVKNRLEGVVEQVKLENEDLIKKDRLAQFELEKSRSRLVSLERENEELKSRINPKEA